MKRYVSFCTAVVLLFLSACGGSSSTLDSQPQSTSQLDPDVQPSEIAEDNPVTFKGQLTLDFAFGTRTGIYSGEVNAAGLPDGHGSFEGKNTTGESWTYDGDWSNGHFNGTGTTTWSTGNKFTGTFLDDLYGGPGTMYYENGMRLDGTFWGDYAVGVLSAGSGDDEISMDVALINGELYGLVKLDSDPAHEPEPLPSVGPTNKIDFFSDDARKDQFNKLNWAHKYSELKNYVDTYIAENDVSEGDSAYKILSLIDEALAYENTWTIVDDEFDGTSILTFDGATSISKTNSVVVSFEGTDRKIQVGFRKNGWLFFDTVEFSVDGESVYSTSMKSWEKTTNVISGGTIEEYCYCNPYDDVLLKFKDANKAIIRFSNTKDNTHFDHTLSKEEINSLYCGYFLKSMTVQLADVYREYEDAVG